jgi:hypothetical protein
MATPLIDLFAAPSGLLSDAVDAGRFYHALLRRETLERRFY